MHFAVVEGIGQVIDALPPLQAYIEQSRQFARQQLDRSFFQRTHQRQLARYGVQGRFVQHQHRLGKRRQLVPRLLLQHRLEPGGQHRRDLSKELLEPVRPLEVESIIERLIADVIALLHQRTPHLSHPADSFQHTAQQRRPHGHPGQVARTSCSFGVCSCSPAAFLGFQTA